MNIEDLTAGETICSCGKTHECSIPFVKIEKEALAEIPAILKKCKASHLFVFYDEHTYSAAGKEILAILEKSGISYTHFGFGDNLIADESAIGSLFIQLPPQTDYILAVGSGNINDIARLFSNKLNIPYMIAATAPSMDGYASSVSPLVMNHLKTTLELDTMPNAIAGSTEILRNAPAEMIAAGAGDLLGKFTSLIDWKLSALINKEYFCKDVFTMVEETAKQCLNETEGLAKRDGDAVGALMKGLVVSGIAISYIGNSRPASGAEHHIAHFWETMHLLNNKRPLLHGIEVGLATQMIHRLYAYFQEENLDYAQAIAKAKTWRHDKWQEDITAVYQAGAINIINREKKEQRNHPDHVIKRIQSYQKNMPEILEILKSSQGNGAVTHVFAKLGVSSSPLDWGISKEMFRQSIIWARELRPRFTVLQMLADLNLLESYAQRLADEVYRIK